MIAVPALAAFVAVSLGALPALARAQDLSFADLVQGRGPAQKIAFADLPDDYRAVELTVGRGGAGIFDAIMNPVFLMMGMFSSLGAAEQNQQPDEEFMTGLLGLLAVHFTNGQTVRVAGQEYLITYRLDVNVVQIIQSSDAPPKIDRLRLDLVKTTAVESISPRPEITKEFLLKFMRELERLSEKDKDKGATPPAEPPSSGASKEPARP